MRRQAGDFSRTARRLIRERKHMYLHKPEASSAFHPTMKQDGATYFAEEAFPFDPSQCVAFTGHRHLSQEDLSKIQTHLPPLLEKCYAQGKRAFLSGGALGFDTVAAGAVLQLRKAHPDVSLILTIPCRSQASRWSAGDQAVYAQMLEMADQTIYVSEDYFPGCMQKRNQFLIQHADTCICYLRQCRGGTWYTVSYAYDLHRTILNLALEKS